MQSLPGNETRWQLYRLLSDPMRLRLLALAAEEELSVGELAELVDEPQPNVSRHAQPLRQAGLLADRKQGTRTLVRLADGATADAVVADAVSAGRRLCVADGSLTRIGEVVARRDAKTREFFARPGAVEVSLSPELPAYLAAFAALIDVRDLALDAGTGDGALLDLLAPLYRRVVAIDRSDVQLSRARERVRARGYDNVSLIEAPIDGENVRAAIGAGADLVVAARVLHHAPRPKRTMRDLAALLRPGGKLLVIDYARHDDERFGEEQADVWLGFSPEELGEFALAAELEDVRVTRLPDGYAHSGPDAQIAWLSLSATRRGPRRTDKKDNGAQPLSSERHEKEGKAS